MSLAKHESWDRFKRLHPPGSVVAGRVSRRASWGFYVDLEESIEGLVDIINVRDEPPIDSANDFPATGEAMQAVALGFDERNFRVALGTRASDFRYDTSLD
jgi:ribosomal protein S1